MGYIYNKRTGYFTREDIVEAEKKDALKSMAIVLLGMLLFLSITINAIFIHENKILKEELDVYTPQIYEITGEE